MVYIDKTTIPHCFIEEKKFEWGEPYTCITPIFNLCISPDLIDIEFTIEILGKNNFKHSLTNLYNILVNREEQQRIHNIDVIIINRESLLGKIDDYLKKNITSIAPWEGDYELADEIRYLEIIENDLQRTLCIERNIYS